MTTPLTPIPSLAQAARAYGASGASPVSAGALNVTGTQSAGLTEGTDFSSMLGNAMQSAIQTLHTSERTTAKGVVGKADVQEVVQAASDAEVTIHTVTGIRDKILSAYSDVMRMSV